VARLVSISSDFLLSLRYSLLVDIESQ